MIPQQPMQRPMMPMQQPMMQPMMQPPMAQPPMAQPQQAPAPMIGGSLQEMIGRMAHLPAQQLHAMAKDPQVGYLAATELRARNERAARLQPPARTPGPQTVVDAEAMKAAQAESMGIMSGIPQQPVRAMAQGGLVSFQSGGETPNAADLAVAQRLFYTSGIPVEVTLKRLKETRAVEALQKDNDSIGSVISNFAQRMGVGAADLVKKIPDALVSFAGGDPNKVPRMGDMSGYGSWDAANEARPLPSGVPPPGADKTPPGTQPPPPLGTGGTGSTGVGGSVGMSRSSSLSGPLPAGLASIVPPRREYITPGDIAMAEAKQNEALKQMEGALYTAPTVDADRAARASEFDWTKQMNPEDPDAAAARAMLRKKLADLEGKEPKNLRQGWIEAGLGMLASTSPFFGVGIGEGGLKGTRVYRDLQSEDARRSDQLGGQMLTAAQAEQARKAALFNTASASVNAREGQREKELAARRAMADAYYRQATSPLEMEGKRAAADASAATAQYHGTKANAEPWELLLKQQQVDAESLRARAAMVAAQNSGSDGSGTSWRDQRAFADALAKGAKASEMYLGRMGDQLKLLTPLASLKGKTGDDARAKIAAIQLQARILQLESAKGYLISPVQRKLVEDELKSLTGGGGPALPGKGRLIPEGAPGIVLDDRG